MIFKKSVSCKAHLFLLALIFKMSLIPKKKKKTKIKIIQLTFTVESQLEQQSCVYQLP